MSSSLVGGGIYTVDFWQSREGSFQILCGQKDNSANNIPELCKKKCLNLCGVPDGGVNSGSAADGLRLIDIGPDYVGHLYSRGNFGRISFLES